MTADLEQTIDVPVAHFAETVVPCGRSPIVKRQLRLIAGRVERWGPQPAVRLNERLKWQREIDIPALARDIVTRLEALAEPGGVCV